MIRAVRIWFALRAATKAAVRYEAYQSRPADGLWSVSIATGLRHDAERKAAHWLKLTTRR